MFQLLSSLPTAIILYCGVGGCSLGLLPLFRELFGIDNDPLVKANWEINFTGEKYVPFWLADIFNLTGEEILRKALLQAGELALLVITAPCQGFSDASGLFDPLNPMNRHFLKGISLAASIKPKVILFENVMGMRSKQMTPIMNEIILRFEEQLPEYRFFCFKVTCLFFFVPTDRERLIYIGIRRDIFKFEPMLFPATRDIEQFRIGNVAPGIEQIYFGQSKKIIRLADDYMPTITATEGIFIFEDGVWKPLADREDYLKKFSSFPDDFKFTPETTPKQKNHLIGNAVPPALMYHLAYYIKHTILGYPEDPATLMLPAAA